MLRVDDRLVGADDRVDVLEEDDPRRDLVRPADALRLLLVLPEVAGRVEELLRGRIGARRCASASATRSRRLVGAATLEVLAHRRYGEHDDLVAVDAADTSLSNVTSFTRSTSLS